MNTASKLFSKILFLLTAVSVGLAASPKALSNILYVPSEYSSIGIAVFVAQPGDTIQIAPGTYYESGLYLNGKAITISGDQAADTIIDGSRSSGPIIFFDNFDISANPYGRPQPEAVVENLTFQNGNRSQATAGQSNNAGAMLMEFSSPTISRCSFLNNVASGVAGTLGSYADNGGGSSDFAPLLANDEFGNYDYTQQVGTEIYAYGGPGGSGSGGAIFADNSSPTIEYCDFNRNLAIGGPGGVEANGGDAWGGAIAFTTADKGPQTLFHCTFENNQTIGGAGGPNAGISVNPPPQGVQNQSGGNAGGGALAFYNADVAITNCLFTGNSATGGGGGGDGLSSGYIKSGYACGGAVRAIAGITTIDDSVFNGDFTSTDSTNISLGGAVYTNASTTDGQNAISTPVLNVNASTVTNCYCTGNYIGFGHGEAIFEDAVGQSFSTVNLENSLFYGDNFQGDGGEVADLSLQSCEPSIVNCDIDTSFITDTYNIVNTLNSVDPKFVNGPGGDLHLDWDSPCLGAGVYDSSLPSADYDGKSRPNPPSIGAYEFERTISASGLNVTPTAGIPFNQPLFQIVDSSGTATAADIPSSDLSIEWGDGSGNGTGMVEVDHVDDAGTHFNVYDSANPPHTFATDGIFYPELILGNSLLANYFSYGNNGAISTATVGGNSLPASQLTLTSSANPSASDVPVTFTVSIPHPAEIAPSGVFYFYANGNYIGTAPMGYTDNSGLIPITYLNGGRFSWTSGIVGGATITAEYSGDLTDGPGTVSLTQAYSGFATTAIIVPQTIAPPGIASVFLVTVSPTYTYFPGNLGLSPYGTVSIYDGTTLVGQALLSPNQLLDQTSAYVAGALPTAGQRTLTVSYSGYPGLYAPTSGTVSITVPQDQPTLTLTTKPTTAFSGQGIKLTASLINGYSAAGTVQFIVDSSNYGAPTGLANNSATLTVGPLAPGQHTVQARYTGDTNNAAAVSSTVSITVREQPDITSLSLSPAHVSGGDQSTCTLTLSAAPSKPLHLALSSSDATLASVPAALTIPAGSATATFTVKTINVAQMTRVRITASGAGTRSAELSIEPVKVQVIGISIDPGAVKGGQTAQATVHLSHQAYAGYTVAAASSSAFAAVPAIVSATAGSATVTFSVSTTEPTTKVEAKISVTGAGGPGSLSKQLTVSP